MARHRKFSIRHTAQGACSVEEEGLREVRQFSDVKDALGFIRAQRSGGKPARLSFFDSDGKLLFQEEH